MSKELYIICAIVAVLFVIVFILVIKLISTINKMNQKQKKLNRILSGDSVEDLLVKNLKQQEMIANELVNIKNDIIAMEERQKRNIDRVGLIRYPATSDTEAKLSYSVGFSNEAGDGIVITGLYFRQGVNMYFKHVKEGVPDYALTEEEKKVLQRSKIEDITS